MYDARGAMNEGGTSYVTTTIAPVSTIHTRAPKMADDVVVEPGNGRRATWVWLSGLFAILLGSVALLRRKMVARTSNDD